jgi:hypothetical protein
VSSDAETIIVQLVVPLSRKNTGDGEAKKIKTFERQKERLAKVADMKELRGHLEAVRTHLEQVKPAVPTIPEVETP